MKIITLFFGIMLSANLYSATPLWNGHKAAVVLTYDDALNVHLDKVAPSLNQYGMKATFYVSVGAPAFKNRLNDWRVLANQGHELGNHTVYHPCDGSLPNRQWVIKEHDLANWSVQRMSEELQTTNTMLQAVDGKSVRSFAYTCGDTKASGLSFVETIKPYFIAARGVNYALQQPTQVDLFNVNAYGINNDPIEKLTKLVDDAIAQQGLLVFLFHGVGGEHSLNIANETHQQLLAYIAKQQQQIWVAPMVEVAQFIQQTTTSATSNTK